MSSLQNIMRAEAQKAMQGQGTTRLGTISSYDPNTHAVKVNLQPDGTETGWLPLGSLWVGNGWGLFCAPSIGDQVQVEFQEGDKSVGIACHRFFNDVDRPLPVPSGEFWLQDKSGSYIKVLNNGQIKSKSQTWVHEGNMSVTGNVTITGNELVQGMISGQNGLAITGTSASTVSGGLNLTGDVTADGISLKNHTHSGVQSGGSTSGPPVAGGSSTSSPATSPSARMAVTSSNPDIFQISGNDSSATDWITISLLPQTQYAVLMGNGSGMPTFQSIPLAALPSSLATTSTVNTAIASALTAALASYAMTSTLSNYVTTSALGTALGPYATLSALNSAIASIPVAATATPLANGSAAVGTATKYAREDHIHPVRSTRPGITGVTTDLTLNTTHGTVGFDCSTASRTVTFPDALAYDGYVYTIVKVDSSTNTVTMQGVNNQTFNRATTRILYSQDSSYTWQAVGGNWLLITSV